MTSYNRQIWHLSDHGRSEYKLDINGERFVCLISIIQGKQEQAGNRKRE